MLSITTPSFTAIYPSASEAIIVPTGYPQSPEAFDTTVTELLRYFKSKQFDIEIMSSPETFSTIELNSNVIRLGKMAVKDIALPVLVSILSSFIYDNYIATPSVDSDPVKLKICIEVCDSSDMRVNRRIDFEGTPEQFDEMKSNISDLLKEENGL